MRRREFLRSLPVQAAAVGALAATACAGPAYVAAERRGSTLSVPRASLPPGRPSVVAVPGWDRPLLLRLDASEGWVALEARCTHRGCEPEPIGERLVCPCHGSEYSLTGEVLEGPAERPLRRFAAREEDGRVVIDLGGSR